MKRATSSGFTLVELIVYLAIFSVASVLVVMSVIQLAQVFGKARSERLIALSAESALDRILREVRLACDISVSPDFLTLTLTTFPDFGEGKDCSIGTGPRTINFDSANGWVLLDGILLTSPNITVSNFAFTEVTSAPQKAVHVRMTITSGQGRYLASRTYSGFAVARGMY